MKIIIEIIKKIIEGMITTMLILSMIWLAISLSTFAIYFEEIKSDKTCVFDSYDNKNQHARIVCGVEVEDLFLKSEKLNN